MSRKICIFLQVNNSFIYTNICASRFFIKLTNILASFPFKQLNLPISNHNCKVTHVWILLMGFPSGSVVKSLPANAGEAGDVGLIPGSGRPLGRNAKSTTVFLPGQSCGQRSLTGYSPWGHKESDMTEYINIINISLFGEHLCCCWIWASVNIFAFK